MTMVNEELRRRQLRAADWICEAEKHIRAARLLRKRPGLENLVLFHIQQSMEMGTKALATASGIPHGELRKDIGHNNLFLLGNVTKWAVDSMQGSELIDAVLSILHREGKEYGSATRIQDFLKATASPKTADALGSRQYARAVFASGLGMPPEEVESMLDQFDRTLTRLQIPAQTKRQLKRLLAAPLYFTLPPPEENLMESLYAQATGQLEPRSTQRPNPAVGALMRGMAQEIGNQIHVSDYGATPGEIICFHGQQLLKEAIGMQDMVLANLGLLIVGSLVWPHESYSRYPAAPGAPESIDQAVRERKLGVKHYTQEMGVIHHIRPITERAGKTIRMLRVGYEAGFLLMTTEDVSSRSL